MWSSASSNELRILLPITATGPLKVETKPILTVFCWAIAGPAASIKAALATNKALRMYVLPLGRFGPFVFECN